MKALKLTILFCFTALLFYGQGNSKYPLVGEFKGLYKFNKCCMYDIELQRQYNKSNCEAIVSFTVDANSTGTLAFFMIEKLRYKVLHCYKVENEYQFNLQLDNGKIIVGLLKVDANNAVESFWLFAKPDIAIVAYSE